MTGGADVPPALLAAAPNFRGLSVAADERSAAVYRSGHLGALDGPAREALAGLGVTSVFDLRTSAERRGAPNKLPVGTSVVLADVLADNPTSGAARLAAISATPGRPDVSVVNEIIGNGGGKDIMVDCYRDFVRLPSARAEYAAVLRGMAASAGPVTFHCTAGKDRTGWLAVVLQRLAAVPEEVVLADYLQSNEVTAAVLDKVLLGFGEAGGDVDGLSYVVNVHADYIAAADDQVVADHGSFDDYVANGLGLRDGEVAALRGKLRG